MKSGIQKELKKFYQEISKVLPRDGKKTLLPDIKTGVDSFLAENPDATIDDVVSYVGTPECIANEYYANQDGTKITREINASRIILIAITSIVLLALLIYIGFILVTVINDIFTYPAYAVTELEKGPVFDVTSSDMLMGIIIK